MEFLRMIFRYRYQQQKISKKNNSIIESTVELWMQKNATEIFIFFSCQFHSQMENTHTQMLFKLQTEQKCLTRCVCIIYVTDKKWHGSWQCKTVRTVLTKYSVSYKHCKVKLMNPSFKDPYTVCTYHVCFNSRSERGEMVHCHYSNSGKHLEI